MDCPDCHTCLNAHVCVINKYAYKQFRKQHAKIRLKRLNKKNLPISHIKLLNFDDTKFLSMQLCNFRLPFFL